MSLREISLITGFELSQHFRRKLALRAAKISLMFGKRSCCRSCRVLSQRLYEKILRIQLFSATLYLFDNETKKRRNKDRNKEKRKKERTRASKIKNQGCKEREEE